MASLGTSINVIWRERLKGRKTAATRRLNGAHVLSSALSACVSHPFVFHYISNVRLISATHAVDESNVTCNNPVATF